MAELDAARSHLEDGRLEQAAALLQAIVTRSPDDGEAWMLLGMVAHRAGQPRVAAQMLQRATRARPDDVEVALALALAHHAAGDLDEASAKLRRILELDEGSAIARARLGDIHAERGETLEAVACYEAARAAGLDEDQLRNNLAVALISLGREQDAELHLRELAAVRTEDFDAQLAHARLLVALERHDDARAAFVRALAVRDDADAHHELGLCEMALGRAHEAIACYERALELAPERANLCNDLGVALVGVGRSEAAEGEFRRALALEGDDPNTHFNLGTLLRHSGRVDEAIACYRRTVELDPEHHRALNNVGVMLGELGELAEALAWCRRSIEVEPEYAQAWFNLGNAHRELGQLDEAATAFTRALELEPSYHEASNNLAIVLAELDRTSEAIATYEAAIERRPWDPELKLNRSFLLLRCARFLEGWREYEHRWRSKKYAPRRFDAPLWRGQPSPEATLLLHGEQGLGDTIQFVRYAIWARPRVGRVLLLCQRPLVALLAGVEGVDATYADVDALPAFDLQAPLMQLPGDHGTSDTNIVSPTAYLAAEPARVESFRARASSGARLRVGVVWQGNPDHVSDHLRSIPLATFAPLAGVDGVELIGLQYGPGTEQLAGEGPGFAVTDWSAHVFDFRDLAAAIASLDLVIACDTAVAHLAGALGGPVWVALATGADWRWLERRSDCPWYAHMRLFRQPQPRRWGPVFEQMAAQLADLEPGH